MKPNAHDCDAFVFKVFYFHNKNMTFSPNTKAFISLLKLYQNCLYFAIFFSTIKKQDSRSENPNNSDRRKPEVKGEEFLLQLNNLIQKCQDQSQRGHHPGNNPETHCDFGFRPALGFEMVMNWRGNKYFFDVS